MISSMRSRWLVACAAGTSVAHNSAVSTRPSRVRREDGPHESGREPIAGLLCIGVAFAVLVVCSARVFEFAQDLQVRTGDSRAVGNGVPGSWRGGGVEGWSNGVME